MGGCLLLCATPIGNLEDITQRALGALRAADIIYAEDTRHTAILLAHYGIAKPLRSCHAHNERQRADEVVAAVAAGQRVVYVSDAGTPGIADPGARLLRSIVAAGLEASVLPGPSALIAAVALAGLDGDGHFSFYGFPPRRSGARRAQLSAALFAPMQAVWFEAPNRLANTLAELCALGGMQRPAAVVRELTKVYEEVRRDTLHGLLSHYTEHPPRGEVVLCVAAAVGGSEAPWDEALAAVDARRACGERLSSAVAEEATLRGISRSRLYRETLRRSIPQAPGQEGECSPPSRQTT